ncbi:3',5'-cyclic-AMP phosphodiesterase [Allohahella sp. A8]|mgnify:CR=1 FL=1|uniref:3',5'-cyclic-AMP phosphodiesterase n=1 Tax=Allohahella sp. A8 TaxID=3141461 RepID=UPI000C093055|nr:3',5'-cyclic-AMP phosphodiesterase [Hahellaceae bacterium]|tara:strand:+ start:8996 stop:9865 length:870 start_codon:yes stop_codon:yes gene_type:complete
MTLETRPDEGNTQPDQTISDSHSSTVTAKPLRIVQISDPHLCETHEGTLLGLKTHDSLDAVLALVDEEVSKPDLIIATGDITQDRSREAYADFCQQIARFGCPVVWIPGNHDDADMMAEVAPFPELQSKTFVLGDWKFIFLNTAVPGKVHGRLAAEELQLLQSELDNAVQPNIAVCLHHHPISIRSRWLDKIGLRNADDFFEVTDRCDRIRAIVWGHIHQEIDELRNNVRMLASPSTCVQFKPESGSFAVGEQAPGYRWFDLFADGRIETRVERADHIEFIVDMNSKGY